MATGKNVLALDATKQSERPLRVLLCCSGTGRINRGIESFFREAFDGLEGTTGLHLRLLKGAGVETADERVLWSVSRTSPLARILGRLAKRNGYVFEQWSSLLSVAAQIREFRPDVVFYSEANLGFLLFGLRRWIGVPYKLVFSNGAPVRPPFERTDFVHQVTPVHLAEALQAGEPAERHFCVPYGIRLVNQPGRQGKEERAELRQQLGIPAHRQIVLSVGWVRRAHKRMHYVIHEIASLPYPRPYLQLVGLIDEQSQEIINLGKNILGQRGFGARSVPYQEVFKYYQIADCFVLASVKEGFGRAYLEALMHGLPVLAHEYPVSKYVLGEHGIFGDLTRAGSLAALLNRELKAQPDAQLISRRWMAVRDRFSWPVLARSYREMFQVAATAKINLSTRFGESPGRKAAESPVAAG
ncbi:MAG TPA: glycosyltransferase family 4 protein [Verrucomicrobiae bacterium]|nr:glycosyltransferase family 4 protein [Verrucomicrobiae bacterium]